MVANGTEIRIGQKWRKASGGFVVIDSIGPPTGFCISGIDEHGAHLTFTSNGRYSLHGKNPNDIVGLIEDAPAVEQANPCVEDNEESHSSIVMDVPGYEKLAAVLQDAYNQAAIGKGRERHANDKPFHEQPMCAISRNLGSIDGLLYQATKKPQEARGLPTRARALAEIYGAINYLAGAAILIEEGIIKEQE